MAHSNYFSNVMAFGLGKRSSQSMGVGCVFLAVFLLLSLLSYHSGDPSLNRASTAPIANWMGAGGAIIADLLLQLFGLGSLVLVGMLAAWGWRLLVDNRIINKALRTVAMMVALVAFSSVFAVIPAPASWAFNAGLGGNLGALVLGALKPVLHPFITAAFALIVGGAAVVYTLALRREEWQTMGWWGRVGAGYGVKAVRYVNHFLRGDATAMTLNDTRQSSLQTHPIRKEDSRKEEPARFVKPERHVTVSNQETSKPKQSSFELRIKKGAFELPATDLLAEAPKAKHTVVNADALKQNAAMLESVLRDFGVNGDIINIHPGPVVTLYELEPSPGTKSSRVIGLADDIARSMSAISTRIAVIPGRNALGIELPNTTRQTVYMREILEHEVFAKTKAHLPMALGKNIGGEPIVVDLAKMPHLLVAGTTGSGKSVAINTMIASLLYHHTPDTCKFIMIDPKMLELSVYNDIPHLLTPVVTEPAKAVVALKWTVKEMENRYRAMASLGVRNIENYNKRVAEAKRTGETLTREVQTGFEPETGRPTYERLELDTTPLPFIVVVVDEMADLMLVAGKDIEGSIQRLAQMARAAGIHIIMATQRPSVDVITGVIKANFPTRISFQVTSKIDSRTILGEQGAEQLLGQGDMLYMVGGGRIMRVHGPFVSDSEVEDIVTHLKKQGVPEYIEEVTRDDNADGEGSGYDDGEESEEDKLLYDRAVAIVARDRKASTSYIQRCLKIGYNRAASLIDRMERDGIVSSANHVGKREVLVPEGRD
jgi:DNA segregation ATPase FtsK/SpoIIIE, S-DNA-T family